MSNKYILGNVYEEIKQSERAKKVRIEKEFENSIKDLEKSLKISMQRDEPNNSYVIYTGVYGGKEIRIGGVKTSKVKKILIFDTLNLSVIYTGLFKEESEHYVGILKSYNKKKKDTKGYYRKY